MMNPFAGHACPRNNLRDKLSTFTQVVGPHRRQQCAAHELSLVVSFHACARLQHGARECRGARLTVSVWPRMTCSHLPPDQTRMVLSLEPVMSLPSGRKRTHCTAPSCPSSTSTHLPSAHTRAVLHAPPAQAVVHGKPGACQRIKCVLLALVLLCRNELVTAAWQEPLYLSRAAEAICPSGPIARSVTCASSRHSCKPLAIHSQGNRDWRERWQGAQAGDATHLVRVPLQCLDAVPGGGVPQLDGGVPGPCLWLIAVSKTVHAPIWCGWQHVSDLHHLRRWLLLAGWGQAQDGCRLLR